MNKNILKRLFTVFRTFNISYTLIGGYAVAVWGFIRATKDVDFLADIPFSKIQDVLNELKSHEFIVEYSAGDIEDPVSGVIRLRFPVEGAAGDEESIELLLGIKKMPVDIYLRSEKVDLMGVEIPVVSPEDLIVLKLLAGGPVDLQDARSIYKIVKERLDLSYLGKELRRCKFSIERLETS